MYHSHLLINVGDNPDRPDWNICRRWLRNPYRVHQRLCMGFPSAGRREADPAFLQPFQPGDFDGAPGGDVHQPRGPAGGFLFRIDLGHPPVVVVQSARRPDWEYAFANASFLLAGPPHVREYVPVLQSGRRLRFRLRANPTVKRAVQRDGQAKPARHALLDEADQRAWLMRKAQGAGFTPLDFAVTGVRRVTCSSPKGKQTHVAVDFEGLLEVTDPAAFQAALAGGIGPAKGFGFGLLSIAPA